VAVGVAVALGAGMVRAVVPGPEAMRLVAGILTGGLSGLLALYVTDRRFVRESLALLRTA
jgi:LytS/YehU family sensor histidine kinase